MREKVKKREEQARGLTSEGISHNWREDGKRQYPE